MMFGISSMVHPARARGGGCMDGGGLFSSRVLLRRASPTLPPPWRMEWMMCFCAQDDARGGLPAVADARVLAD
eukprot:615207-Prorocentrum_lima.AAC.1